MSKTAIIIIVLILVAGGSYFVFQSPEVEAPGTEATENEVVENTMPVLGGENVPEMIVAEEKIITYTDAGYSPSAVNIKVGDVVTFKNESKLAMWPASAKHPTHTVYPTTGGCFGSTFDACKGLQPGESWSFQFDIAGEWKYHDHLTPKYFGSIVVKE